MRYPVHYSRVVAACGVLFALTAARPAAATPFLFAEVHDIGEALAVDLAKPTIAANGTIAFLDVRDFATDERITVVDAFGNATILLDSDDPVRPSNLTGPGISDNGAFVAYVGREQGGTTDRIYRQPAGGGLATLIAGPGLITAGVPGDPIGAVACRGTCQVTDSGSVFFTTFGPTTLSYGDGGVIGTFATGGAIVFHDEFGQSGVGFKLAVLETGGGEQLWSGFGSISNGVLWADTTGPYSAFRSPNVTDGANIAVIAERDLGGEEILAHIDDGLPSLDIYATTNGPFASFDDLSLGDLRDIVFLAELDSPGSGTAIYTGPDPVKDRLVGPGDVFFNKTVVEVDLAPSHAINRNGQIAFAVRYANGTAEVVRASPFTGLFLQKAVALLSTLDSASSPMLSTVIDVPTGIFDLSFELDFLTDDGLLDVLFGGELLGRFTPGMDGATLLTGIDPAALFGRGIPAMADLSFRLSGGPGVSVHLDDIVIPGHFMESFEEGYLERWRVDDGGGGLVALSTTTRIVAEPGALWLLVPALLAVGSFVRRDRGRDATRRPD